MDLVSNFSVFRLTGDVSGSGSGSAEGDGGSLTAVCGSGSVVMAVVEEEEFAVVNNYSPKWR